MSILHYYFDLINKKIVRLDSKADLLARNVHNGKNKQEDLANYINNYLIRPDVAKHMKIDYKILEKIYDNIYFRAWQIKNS